MSEDSYLFEKKSEKRGNWFGRLLKISFVLIAFYLITITVLSNMGGTNDMLKESLEKFVSQTFGGKTARVGKLVNMSFFPNVGVDAQNIQILPNKDEENTYPLFSIGRLQTYVGFWDVVMQSPNFKQIYAEDIRAIKGVFGPQDIYIEKVFIDHDIAKEKAHLRGNGKIAYYPWTINAALGVHGNAGYYRYRISKDIPFTATLGDLNLSGTFIKGTQTYFSFDPFEISSKNNKISGKIGLYTVGEYLLKLTGDLTVNENGGVISPELVIDLKGTRTKISGTIEFNNISPKDLSETGNLYIVLSRVLKLLSDRETKESGALALYDLFLGQYDYDVKLQFDNFSGLADEAKDFSAAIRNDNGRYKMGPVELKNGEEMMPVLYILPRKEEEQKSILFVQNPVKSFSFISQLNGMFGTFPEKSAKGDEACFVLLLPEKEKIKSNVVLDKVAYDFIHNDVMALSSGNPCLHRIELNSEDDQE